MDREYIFAALTLGVCLHIAGISMCRLRLTGPHIRVAVRIKYSLLGSSALVFGFSPWVGEWPGWTGLTFCLCVLAGLLTNSARWGRQPPAETRCDFCGLDPKDERTRASNELEFPP